MNPYYHLPPEQRLTQRFVDQFNADERLWKKLEPKRQARRKLRPRPSHKGLKKLDLLEFAKARPLQDCLGQWSDSRKQYCEPDTRHPPKRHQVQVTDTVPIIECIAPLQGGADSPKLQAVL